jgi:hypothetical protein
MLEIGTSGLMSGEGKRGDAVGPSYRASPRLYYDGRLGKINCLLTRRVGAEMHRGLERLRAPRGGAGG